MKTPSFHNLWGVVKATNGFWMIAKEVSLQPTTLCNSKGNRVIFKKGGEGVGVVSISTTSQGVPIMFPMCP
jgi:hypothetical protein